MVNKNNNTQTWITSLSMLLIALTIASIGLIHIYNSCSDVDKVHQEFEEKGYKRGYDNGKIFQSQIDYYEILDSNLTRLNNNEEIVLSKVAGELVLFKRPKDDN